MMARMALDPAFRHLIASFRKSPNWDGQLDLHLLQALWPSLVGAALAQSTSVTAIQGSSIVVNVPDRTWRKQLVKMKKQILKKVNEPWPTPWITEISFTHEDYGR